MARACSREARKASVSVYEFMKTKATAAAAPRGAGRRVDKLTADFGKWQTPWGDINRFQRIDGDIVQQFDDASRARR